MSFGFEASTAVCVGTIIGLAITGREIPTPLVVTACFFGLLALVSFVFEMQRSAKDN